jgi:hypothetical protein
LSRYDVSRVALSDDDAFAVRELPLGSGVLLVATASVGRLFGGLIGSAGSALDAFQNFFSDNEAFGTTCVRARVAAAAGRYIAGTLAIKERIIPVPG